MSVLLLADAKAHLNINDADHDAELQDFIDAAEATIATRVGPLAPTSVTVRVYASGTVLLPVGPVISLVSMATADGTAVDLSTTWVDPDAGVVRFADGWCSFAPGFYDVTYVAGRSVVPLDLVMAIKEQVRHMWTTQRGGSTRPGSTMDQPSAGYLVPNRVAELIEPYRVLFVA